MASRELVRIGKKELICTLNTRYTYNTRYLRDHGDDGAAQASDEAGHVDEFDAGRDPREDPHDCQRQRRDA